MSEPRIAISFKHSQATWMWQMSLLDDYMDIEGKPKQDVLVYRTLNSR